MLYVIGIGPGEKDLIPPRAREALEAASLVVGYPRYVKLIRDLVEGKEIYTSPMRKEVERCEYALSRAAEGITVAVVSSGDPGVYGMAGLIIELSEKGGYCVDIEVIPGISAAHGAAALLGAPLMHDFAVISLSDLLTPWEMIRKRLELAARGDFITVLYNPRSRGRRDYLSLCKEIFLSCRQPDTPVGMVKNAYREGEEVSISSLSAFSPEKADMLTTVIIGNSLTAVVNGKMVTPRGYLF